MVKTLYKAVQVAVLGLLLLPLLAGSGCASKSTPQTFGDKAEDWKRSTPPPGWHGPGDPASADKMRAPSGPPAGKTP